MWKQKEKAEPCAQGQIKPNALRRALGIFRPSFASTISGSPTSLSNKEIRTHQIEVEQKRSIAIEYARRKTLG